MEETKKRRLLFIYNPTAGKGRIRNKLSVVVERFSQEGYEVIVHPTKCKGDARDTAYLYASQELCDRMVCAGGDGTFSETAGGILLANSSIPLGYIPEGTTNDFAYSLKLPTNITKAMELAISGIGCKNDIGILNETPFTYTASFGLFTEVSYETPQNVKNAIGHMAYLLNAASRLMNIRSYEMKVEGDDFVFEGEFIHGMIANSNSVGGFRGITGKNVELDDGIFEMILIQKPKSILDLNDIVNALLTNKLETSKNIYYQRVSRVTLFCDQPIAWNLDGEFGGDFSEARIFIHKQKLNYITKSIS